MSDLNGLEEDLSYSELIGDTGLSATAISIEGSLTGGSLHHAHSHAPSTQHAHSHQSVVGGEMIKKQASAATTSANLS